MPSLELKKCHSSQNFWNFVITGFVALAVFLSLPFATADTMRVFQEMTPFHFLIVALATFRLTRLFVADFITGWLRDMFMKCVVVHDKVAKVDYVRYEKYDRGLFRVISDLFGCPWCMGVWMAFVSLALYYAAVTGMIPGAWAILFVFALAGAGEFAYALVGSFLTPHSNTLLVDERGVNILSGQKHDQSENVCTECGK